MQKNNSSDNYELDELQQEELDKRLEKYEAGQMKFSSWDKVKERIRNKAKNPSLIPINIPRNGKIELVKNQPYL